MAGKFLSEKMFGATVRGIASDAQGIPYIGTLAQVLDNGPADIIRYGPKTDKIIGGVQSWTRMAGFSTLDGLSIPACPPTMMMHDSAASGLSYQKSMNNCVVTLRGALGLNRRELPVTCHT